MGLFSFLGHAPVVATVMMVLVMEYTSSFRELGRPPLCPFQGRKARANLDRAGKKAESPGGQGGARPAGDREKRQKTQAVKKITACVWMEPSGRAHRRTEVSGKARGRGDRGTDGRKIGGR